ncbi:uncharacterized protein LOC143289327 [Babylonia areolata]|uniref:uncharacterized protein LOC143289327 n=1 Tax=Babylonia areolata TaxID=304850 RepID=UPI003FD13F6E
MAERCAQCGKQGDSSSIKRCSRCKAVRYCSTTCQSRDWPRHRVTCGESSVDGALPSPGPGGASSHSTSSHSTSSPSSQGHTTTTTSNNNPFASLFDGTFYASPWQRARSRAEQAFPGNEVTDNVLDLDLREEEVTVEHRMPFIPFGLPFMLPVFNPFLAELMTPRVSHGRATCGKVVLVRLVSRIVLPPNMLGWEVQDCNGKLFHVWFAMESSAPYFRSADLQEGNFLCVKQAVVDVLPRERVCFIVLRDASLVRVFPAGEMIAVISVLSDRWDDCCGTIAVISVLSDRLSRVKFGVATGQRHPIQFFLSSRVFVSLSKRSFSTQVLEMGLISVTSGRSVMEAAEACAHCGLPGVALPRCTVCWAVRYCSRDCQRRHWPRHKRACVRPEEGQGNGQWEREKKKDKKKRKEGGKKSSPDRKTPSPTSTTPPPAAAAVGKEEEGEGEGGARSAGEGPPTTSCPPPLPGNSLQDVCKTCKTKIEETVRCERCQDVTYCSRDCRRADWLTHRMTCKPVTPAAESPDEKEHSRMPEETDGAETSQPEDGCLPLESAPEEDEAQTGEKDAGALVSSEQAEEDDDDVKTCLACKAKKKDMKKCGRCQSVTYCSRDCQRADWPSHKVTCHPMEVLTTDGYRETERRERAERARQEEIINLANVIRHSHRFLHMFDQRQRLSWQEARARARGLFPLQRIVTDFKELDSDFMGIPFLTFNPMMLGAGEVAVGRLTTPYFHPFRPARRVEDVNGMSVYVIFYMDCPSWPYFQFSQFKEGNFICIQGAFLHMFADGSVGFRIDDASEVRILECEQRACKSEFRHKLNLTSTAAKMNDSDRKYFMDSWMKDLKDGKGPYKYVTTLDTCGRSCALCRNPSNLQRCGRCFRVFYCSKDCQRLDWSNHRSVCLEVTARASASAASSKSEEASPPGGAKSNDIDSDSDKSPGPVGTCEGCKRTGQSLKTCSRCCSASYCSKECQRDDWKQHKKDCKKIEKSRVQKDWEAGKMFQELARAMDPSLTVTARRSHRPPLSWTQAVQEARRLHQDKTVLTKLRDVMEEEDLDPMLMTSTVFLARLVKPHPYIFRHAWYLEDMKGQQVRIFFYLDHDVPEPYFRWQQLDVGNFVCLEHAYIHTFMDGTTGIRVDDACDVGIIGE